MDICFTVIADFVMATTETSAIIMKGATEQNKKLDGFSYAHPEYQFCFVLLCPL